MSDQKEPFEQDRDWFKIACKQDQLPAPKSTELDIFATMVFDLLRSKVYSSNPVNSARKEVFELYKSKKWGICVPW